MERRIVCLEALDGFEFEDFCAELFRRLRYKNVKLASRVADMGRDILMDVVAPSGKIEPVIVECKHHLGKTIGRPVVQKLHSAVITFSAKKGIVITTGHFSEEARKHTEMMIRDVKIDLIDLSQLKILGERVGFEIYETSADVPFQSFHICKSLELDEIIRRETDRMISHPKSPREVIQLSEHEIQLQPAYFLTYSIDRDFITSTGRIIHSIRLSDAPLLADGRNGELYADSVAEFLKKCERISLKHVERLGVSRPSYLLSENGIKERAVEKLVKRHTTTIVYYAGRGRGRRIEKECSLSRRDIKIIYTEKIYVPKWELRYTALRTSYSVVAYAKPNDLLQIRNDFEECAVCNKVIKLEKRILCNDCGKIGHVGFFTKHSFRCKNCKKTLCKSCANERREWLILKRRYCGECFNKISK